MQSRLPRELRDMVYASVFQDSDSFVVSHDILPDVLESYQHLCDTTFVGQETLVELAEEWHHHCIFHLNLNSDGRGLYDTGKNIWNLPNLDFVRHMRHVQVEICPPYVEQDEGSIDLEGMPEGWQYLYKLQRPATLALKVDYDEWTVAYRPQDLHDDFVGLLTYLIGAGVKVIVELTTSHRSNPCSGSVGLEHLENEMWCYLLDRVWHGQTGQHMEFLGIKAEVVKGPVWILILLFQDDCSFMEQPGAASHRGLHENAFSLPS